MASIGVGDTAPDYTKATQNGDTISLSQYRGDKTVVLYFYPKDNTPGCTKQACNLRDNYSVLLDAGIEFLGSQGDVWDAQKDMLADTLGAIAALLLFTDGVLDAQSPREERFGAAQMLDIAQADPGRSAQNLQADLLAGLQEFVGDMPQFDDITLMTVLRTSQ